MTTLLLLLALTTSAEARPHRGHDDHDRPRRDHTESHIMDRRGNDVRIITHWIGPFRLTFIDDVPDRNPQRARGGHHQHGPECTHRCGR